MYKVIEKKTGYLLDEIVTPLWVKQQRRVDFPISVDTYEEADGIILNDGTIVGLDGRNMENYEPIVVLEKTNAEPYLFSRVKELEGQLETVKAEQAVNKQLQLDGMQGTADLYMEQAANKQLQLDTMQGIADLYSLLLTNSGAGGV